MRGSAPYDLAIAFTAGVAIVLILHLWAMS